MKVAGPLYRNDPVQGPALHDAGLFRVKGLRERRSVYDSGLYRLSVCFILCLLHVFPYGRSSRGFCR